MASETQKVRVNSLNHKKPLLSKMSTVRANKDQMIANSDLREKSEPAVFGLEVAKQLITP